MRRPTGVIRRLPRRVKPRRSRRRAARRRPARPRPRCRPRPRGASSPWRHIALTAGSRRANSSRAACTSRSNRSGVHCAVPGDVREGVAQDPALAPLPGRRFQCGEPTPERAHGSAIPTNASRSRTTPYTASCSAVGRMPRRTLSMRRTRATSSGVLSVGEDRVHRVERRRPRSPRFEPRHLRPESAHSWSQASRSISFTPAPQPGSTTTRRATTGAPRPAPRCGTSARRTSDIRPASRRCRSSALTRPLRPLTVVPLLPFGRQLARLLERLDPLGQVHELDALHGEVQDRLRRRDLGRPGRRMCRCARASRPPGRSACWSPVDRQLHHLAPRIAIPGLERRARPATAARWSRRCRPSSRPRRSSARTAARRAPRPPAEAAYSRDRLSSDTICRRLAGDNAHAPPSIAESGRVGRGGSVGSEGGSRSGPRTPCCQ